MWAARHTNIFGVDMQGSGLVNVSSKSRIHGIPRPRVPNSQQPIQDLGFEFLRSPYLDLDCPTHETTEGRARQPERCCSTLLVAKRDLKSSVRHST